MLIVYGIPHCDTVKAARKWLTERGIAHEFHDLRKEHHLDVSTLEHWLEQIGCQRLVNRSSATWRTLDSSQREQVEHANPVPVILANPTLIKRPVLVGDGILHVGFSASDYQRLFPAA